MLIQLPESSKNIYYKDKDIYEVYPDKDKISFSDFKLISKTFFHLLTKSMVDEGKVYYLPPKLGTLGIYKTAKTKKMIDYDLYKKTGIKANIQNRHSHGHMGKFYWQTIWPRYRVSTLENPTIFRYKAPRYLSRYLAKQIKENNTISKYYDF